MTPRRPPETPPDLFSEPTMAKAAKPTAAPTQWDASHPAATPTRYVLPQGLALALRTMEDTEFDRLLASVTAEARRRGRMPRVPEADQPAPDTKARQRPPAAANTRPSSLTTGQINAVRAAFKAGVKLPAIARQFGISPTEIKKALEQGGK